MFLLEDETQKIENNYENLLKKGMKTKMAKTEKPKIFERKTESRKNDLSLIGNSNTFFLKIASFFSQSRIFPFLEPVWA